MASTEALRLTVALEHDPLKWCDEAAAELRRLAAVEAQRDALLEALKELTGHINERFSGGVWDRARAAIKQAEGEKA